MAEERAGDAKRRTAEGLVDRGREVLGAGNRVWEAYDLFAQAIGIDPTYRCA